MQKKKKEKTEHSLQLMVRAKEDREVRLSRLSVVVSISLLAASIVSTVTSPVLSPMHVWGPKGKKSFEITGLIGVVMHVRTKQKSVFWHTLGM